MPKNFKREYRQCLKTFQSRIEYEGFLKVGEATARFLVLYVSRKQSYGAAKDHGKNSDLSPSPLSVESSTVRPIKQIIWDAGLAYASSELRSQSEVHTNN